MRELRADPAVDTVAPDRPVRALGFVPLPAGTIAARNNGAGVTGVAPGTRIYAVKVLDAAGSGTQSQAICGINWVTANAAALNIKVANMSLGGTGAALTACPGTTDSDGASGATGGAPACDTREADDRYASYSNYATSSAAAAHTIAAPGTCIRSTWIGSSYSTISGTSMATPHVAGAAALCLGEGTTAGPCAGMTPAQTIARLRGDAQARTQAAPSYGFAGDPSRPVSGRYYGYLDWSGIGSTTPPLTNVSAAPSSATIQSGSLRSGGYGSSTRACAQTVSIYRFSDGAWVRLDARSVGTTETSLTGLAPGGTLSGYVSNGALHVRVRCTTTEGTFYSHANQLGITYSKPSA